MDCISSVQNSTYPDIEHIIIDDGSTPEHSKVLDVIDFPNIIIIHKPNEGVCITRNMGLEIATGEFILPLDADDKISENYVSDAVEVLQKDPNVRVVTSEISQRFGKSDYRIIFDEPFNMGTLLSRNLFHITTMFRACDAIRVGGFDTDFNKGLEDWNFWISMMALGGSVGIIPGTNFYYRIKNIRRNTSFGGEIGHRELQKLIWKKHRDLYSVYYADPYETYAYRALKQDSLKSLPERIRDAFFNFSKSLISKRK